MSHVVAQAELSEACQQTTSTEVTRFVPNVFNQILRYANSADSVNCTIASLKLNAAASNQLRYRLSVPKHGVLLLQWPLCFDSGRRTGKFLSLLRHNVALKLERAYDDAAVIETVQAFLTGYDAMMLDGLLHSMLDNASLYTDLTTLVIHLNVDSARGKNAGFFRATKPADSRLRRRSNKLSTTPKGSSYSKYLLFDWKRWAETITAITDKCGSSLLHLLFIANENNPGQNTPELPPQFYVALQFDSQLARMQNLQTLYLPPIKTYEEALGGKPISTHAWKALHKLPESERLPSLRRVVVDDFNNLIGKDSKNAGLVAATCGLPNFAANVMVETRQRKPSKLVVDVKNTVFCHGRFLIPHVALPEATYSALFDCRERVTRIDSSRFEKSKFSSQLVQYVNNCRQRSKLSFQLEMAQNDNDIVVFSTFCSLLNSSNRQRLQADVRLVLWLPYDLKRHLPPGDDFQGLRDILPFFAVNRGADGIDAGMPFNVLKSLRIVLYCASLRTAITEKDGGCFVDKLGNNTTRDLQHQFKFPNVTFATRLLVVLRLPVLEDGFDFDDDVSGRIESEVKFIQNDMMRKMKLFVRDAVESRTRRDLSFWLYQSVERCEFNFKIYCMLAAEKGKSARFVSRIEEVLEARMDEFKRKVLHQAFSRAFDEQQAQPGVEEPDHFVCHPAAVANSKPLPSLKSIKINAEFDMNW